MFPSQTLSFLRDLEANNTKVWFDAHRDQYEQAIKAPAAAAAAQLAAELERRTGLAHGGKVFRMHRDLRFAKDKRPYNTHVHMAFTPVDGPATRPAWMLGLAPDYFTLGCGVMTFDKPGLEDFRNRVGGAEGAQVAALLETLMQKGVRLSEPELKRVPAPWPKDHPQPQLLRRKGLIGWLDQPDPADGVAPDALERSLAGFDQLRPLFDLLMTH